MAIGSCVRTDLKFSSIAILSSRYELLLDSRPFDGRGSFELPLEEMNAMSVSVDLSVARGEAVGGSFWILAQACAKRQLKTRRN